MHAMEIPAILRELQRKTDWNQSELARALKVTQPTISRWYKGSSPELQQRDRIITLATKHKVLQEGHSPGPYAVPIVGYVGAGGKIAYGEGQGPFGEAPMPPKGGTAETVAVVVRGHSMAPALEDGWLVYYDNRQDPPTDDLFGKLCVCGLTDGRVLIKKLLPGQRPGCFHLISHNDEPMLDQRLDWAARVSNISPS